MCVVHHASGRSVVPSLSARAPMLLGLLGLLLLGLAARTDGVPAVAAAGDADDSDLLDLSCHTDAECRDFVVAEFAIESRCEERQCRCTNRTGPLKCREKDVVTSNMLGLECPCNMKYTECSSGHCICARNFVPSPDRRRCLPTVVRLGGDCERDGQCQQHSVFSRCRPTGNATSDTATSDNTTTTTTSQICQCPENYAPNVQSKCQGLVALEAGCSSDTECQGRVQDSNCLGGRCMCNAGFVARTDHLACLREAGFSGDCLLDVQCQAVLGPGGRCDRMGLESSVADEQPLLGRCICESVDSLPVQIKTGNVTRQMCENRIAIDDQCQSDADCHNHQDAAPATMNCFLGQCICNQETGFVPDGRYCVSSSSSSSVASGGSTSSGRLQLAGLAAVCLGGVLAGGAARFA